MTGAARRWVASCLAACLSAGALRAQDPRQALSDARLDSIVRRVDSMTPRSGAPGTTVRLQSRGMPHLTPLRIGVGAVRFGFEEVGQVMTDQRGAFSVDVVVPAWARRDLIHRFIVFDFYFVPIALSELFHVTDADGLVMREGVLRRDGAQCPSLRTDDGLVYGLTGDLDTLAAGTRVEVEGTLAEVAACARELTLRVVNVRPTPGR
ncbi:MAG TPA: DUF5818 domain-containing protein [Gemmatimonadales bacterium]|nr:DUF5818 domain-containing protein [Gemmatimonadales bacterium]